MELVERTVPQTSRICLDAHQLAMLTCPCPHALHIIEPPMIVPSRIELVVQFIDVFEGDLTGDIHVDAETNLYGRKTLPDNSGDERRCRGQMFGEQSGGIHLLQHRRHMIGECFRDRDVAIAVRVEDRVEFDSVLPCPAEIRDDPLTPRRRPVIHRAAGGHAWPREEDLLDP